MDYPTIPPDQLSDQAIRLYTIALANPDPTALTVEVAGLLERHGPATTAWVLLAALYGATQGMIALGEQLRSAGLPIAPPPPADPPPDLAHGRCSSCKAEIYWARHHKSGKLTPLNREPTPKGNVVITGGLWEVAGPAEPGDRRPHYMPHHATCPQGPQWRRK